MHYYQSGHSGHHYSLVWTVRKDLNKKVLARAFISAIHRRSIQCDERKPPARPLCTLDSGREISAARI